MIEQPPKDSQPKRACSVCLKDQDCVALLIAGPNGVYICDDCVHLASLIIAKAFHDKARRAEDDAAGIDEGREAGMLADGRVE